MLFDKLSHLKKLKKILNAKENAILFPCIQDLVVHGLQLSKFSPEEIKPSRQDITQFIAAWFRYAGFSADDCRDWLIEYSLEVLAVLSSSSLSHIRHSTKSNIKYIYRSEVDFDCGCENNPFKAACHRYCPVYNEMAAKHKTRIEREAKLAYEIHQATKRETVPLPLTVKEKYKDQFETAIKTAADYLKEGLSKRAILKILNDEKFKTRTGRKWSYDLLLTELKKYNYSQKK